MLFADDDVGVAGDYGVVAATVDAAEDVGVIEDADLGVAVSGRGVAAAKDVAVVAVVAEFRIRF